MSRERRRFWRARLRLASCCGRALPMTDDDERLLDEATDWLLAVAERPGDRGLAARLDMWLAMDTRHAAMWQEVNRSYALIGAVEPPAPAAPVTARRPRRRWPVRAHALPRRRTIVGAVAAALLVAWLSPVALVMLRADHRTGTGELKTVTLADGSTAQLGPLSAIRIAYLPGERRVELLEGEALFQVRRDPRRPFSVEAGAVRTTVLGTGFDVRRLRSATHVGVQHGRVRVEHGDAGGRSTVLSAGDEVRIDLDGTTRTDHTPPALIASWALAEVNARDRTVAEVIDDIRPWYAGRIILMDDGLAARRVNGVYNPRNPVQAIRSLIGPRGGSVSQITPWIILVRG